MEKLRDFIIKISSQIGLFWRNLSTFRKALLGTFLTTIFVSLSIVVSQQSSKGYEYLFVDLSAEDFSEISNWLRNNATVDTKIDKKGIQVPKKRVSELRMKLAQEGLPSHGVVGWENFDNKDFTRTEFEQEIQKLRAIQGELSRTITSIEGINSARVHIVTPRQSLFVRNQKKPTAAIYLKTQRGNELNVKTIKGIQHLVSRAVEGLEINNVTIVDSNGKMLTQIESTDYSSRITKQMLTFKKDIESTMEDRIRGIVGRIVGMDRVEAKVDAEVDFTQETQTISDVDPDDVAVISKRTSGYTMGGQGLGPTGIPGAKSNVPGESDTADGVATSKTESSRESETLNYEFSKRVSEKTLPVGNISRLTVSVLVDGKQMYPADGSVPEFVPRTEEEMNKISELISAAVGFKEARGDSLTVHNMMFQLDQQQNMKISIRREEDREYLTTLFVSLAISIALIGFFVMIVRPYFRWLSYDPERKAAAASVEEFQPDLEVKGMQNIQIQEEVPFEKLSPQEQVVYLARHEPKRTTEAIRIMLSPHGGGGGLAGAPSAANASGGAGGQD